MPETIRYQVDEIHRLLRLAGAQASHVQGRKDLLRNDTADRDETIRKAHAFGATFHELSQATYLSRAQIQRICDLSKQGTCEDRSYSCCETLTVEDHVKRYGYAPSSVDLSKGGSNDA